MMTSKTRVFSPVAARFILIAISFIEGKFVTKIVGEQIQIAVISLLYPIRETVKVLSDGNPRNLEQVQAIWNGFVNNELHDLIQTNLPSLISKVKSIDVQKGLTHISIPSLEMIKLLTDNNPQDDQQLISLWGDFVKDPGTHEVVIDHLIGPALISRYGENAEFILSLLSELAAAAE